MRLTNGHGAGLAITGVAVTGFVLLVGVWRAPRWSLAQTAMLFFGASLALMWGFSLRGHFVYGFDISSEYHTFINVLHAGRWHTPHRNDAYGAMVSLTVFPSMLVGLTGASPMLVLKAIYPLLFAFFPVAVFLLGSRVLSRRFAYLAALFIVVQNYMYQQLPAIARQEIALLFFAALLFALFDVRLRRLSRMSLIVVLGLGLVLSHYGTTYLTIGLLGTALVLEIGRGFVISRPPRVPLGALAFSVAVTAAGAALWYVPVTDSAQNLAQFVSDLRHQGLSLLPNAGHQGIVQAYISGNVASRTSGTRFATLAHNDYVKQRRYRYIHPLPQARNPAYKLVNTNVPASRVRAPLLVNGLNVEQILVSQVAILLAVVGALLLWLRRAAGDTARAIALLGVSTLAVLAFIRLSGTATNDYNQSRAYLQDMVPLSICLAWSLQRASRMRRIGQWIPGVSALALGLMFLSMSGLSGAALGGGAPTNLAAKGEDFERYYVTRPELAGARWLNAEAARPEIIVTDRYGELRILGATGRTQGVFAEVTPGTLDRHAWIYADTPMFVGHRVRGSEGSNYALYDWPQFVGQFWNLVYSNGSAGVFARPH
jgi:hypothetical protein